MRFLIFTFIFLLAALSCQDSKKNTEEPPQEEKKATQKEDDKEPPKDFERIVAIGDLVKEVIIELGEGDKIVAIDRHHPSYPEFKKPKVGYKNTLDVKYVLKHNPDAVFSDWEGTSASVRNKNIRKVLEEEGIYFYRFQVEPTLEGTKEMVRKIAKKLKKEKKGEALIQKIDKDLAKIKKDILKKRKDSVKVLYVHARGIENLILAGTKTPMNEIIRLAGAKNAAIDYEDLELLTAEDMPYINPDFLLMTEESIGSFRGRIYEALTLSKSRAYRTGRLVTLENNEIMYVSINVGKIAYKLAEKLYKQPYYTALPQAPETEVETSTQSDIEVTEIEIDEE